MADRTIVVVGAGHAGGRCALTLRELGFDGGIVVVGEEPELPYERPPLSKEMLTGASPLDASRLAEAPAWTAKGIAVHVGARAVDIADGRVVLEDGRRLAFDDLVLATGARVRRLPMFDEPDMPISYLRTTEDARWVRERLTPGVTVLIVGAGVIGLEVASSVVAVGGTALVVEAGPSVMGRAVPASVAARMVALHEAHGVQFRFGSQAVSCVPRERGLVAGLNDGSQIEADLAVIGIGVVPNVELALAAGCEVDDGVVVDSLGRTSQLGVWAIGDVARHPMGEQQVRQETWRHADQHARSVAAALVGGDAAYDEVPGFWSDQYGRRLQVEGHPVGVELWRDGPDGNFAALYLREGQLNGAAVLDEPKVAALARRVISAGGLVDAAAVSDPQTPLVATLRAAAKSAR